MKHVWLFWILLLLLTPHPLAWAEASGGSLAARCSDDPPPGLTRAQCLWRIWNDASHCTLKKISVLKFRREKGQAVEWRACTVEQSKQFTMAQKGDPVSFDYVLIHEDESLKSRVVDEYDAPGILQVKPLRLLSDPLQQLLIVQDPGGSGGYIDWCVLGVVDGALACWLVPDEELPAKKLLHKGETFGHKGWWLKVEGQAIHLERSVFLDDGSRHGYVSVLLKPANHRLNLQRVWRTRAPTAL